MLNRQFEHRNHIFLNWCQEDLVNDKERALILKFFESSKSKYFMIFSKFLGIKSNIFKFVYLLFSFELRQNHFGIFVLTTGRFHCKCFTYNHNTLMNIS